ncbi:RimK family alpha-L-glutamate ligase [Patescibacteria group bacterium]|nr:RimK family alpha-L-glutamate ligase [Patescibacteria group bacterium]MBU1721281.1 RimK family alpha-L-glutamate ligase [Patescibacteria group bacterium]MBU1901011.1 RimK family alpha-L-glutamate ligase [Patescibacteria group bacterium]
MNIYSLTFSSKKKMSNVTKKDFELLEEAAEKRGHKLKLIFANDCQLQFSKKTLGIKVDGKKPKDLYALLIRANFLGTDLDFHSSIIKQFELTGIDVINKHSAVIRAKNKVKTLQVLKQNKIPIPHTYVVRSAEHIDQVVKDIGKYPVIMKSFSGSHGLGVAIVESKRGLKSMIELIIEDESTPPLTIQEYIEESSGKDIRVFIVGGKIIAAMERIALARDEFRSNFHLGGEVKRVQLTPKEKKVALAATKACELDMAGVDILRSNKGPRILEVNANPGLEGITKATGIDVAGAIIDYTIERTEKERRKKLRKKKIKKALHIS